jgi:hypothetical protein
MLGNSDEERVGRVVNPPGGAYTSIHNRHIDLDGERIVRPRTLICPTTCDECRSIHGASLSWTVARLKLSQRFEKSLRVLQIRSVEALGEPAVDLRYELARLRALSLFLP